MTGDSKSADVENFHTEKVDYSYQQTASPNGITQEDFDFLNNFPDEKRKKILRKLRLMPMLTLLYLVAYIDKTNIGNAKIEGMTEDLHLRGLEYNIVVAIFFIPFILCEVPSNMILYKFARPSIYIGSIVLAWGTIMTLTGIVQNYAGLLAIRFLLGIFEAGFLPGAILIISNWYLPNETQVRIALLYTSAATGGAFSGLLAFAIANMSGVAGLRGWRWIFIIEGIFTVAVAVMCFFLLCDTPALSSGWLDAEEIRYLELRQISRRAQMPSEYKESDGGHFNLKIFRDILFDCKIYLLTFASWSNAVPNYAMKFTMPSILTGMGYANSAAQLMTIPPYAIGAVSAFGFAIFADRTSWRYPFLVGPQLCIITAFVILFAMSGDIKDNVAVCYFAVCLACFGMYPVLPSVNAWNVANTPDPAKRSVSIGLLVCTGNVGGLVGSYIYLDKEAPRYPTGYGTSLAFGGAGIIAATCLELLLKRANRKKAAISEEEIHRAFTAEELRQMGEKSPLFMYAL
ncbi:major facilitator superfamily domain-containing protein [Phyllosticta citribraziliensis]|uniref:Major facilitator superfamily domain-containing protein n=1 Tax=Phyllosticta citribraziliensis TaxID=989973 RepID=A0ABR1L3N0_9PEZI